MTAEHNATASDSRSGQVRVYRRLFGLARPEWGRIALATVFLLVGSGAQLAFPRAMGYIIDQASGLRDQSSVDRTALVMLVVFALMGVAVALRHVLFTVIGERVVFRLRAEMFAKLLEQEIGFFDQRSTGELMNRLASDTAAIQRVVSGHISMALRHLVTILGSLCFLAYTSLSLTLLMLLVVPPAAFGAMAYRHRVRGMSRDLQDTLAESSAVAQEAISGMRTVRAFAAEPIEEQRYWGAVKRSFEVGTRRAYAAGVYVGLAQFVAFSEVVVVMWCGSRMVMTGRITLGELTSFLVYSLLVAAALGGLMELWTDIHKATGAGERVFELFERSPAMPPRGGRTLSQVRGEMRFESLSFSYPTRPSALVLHNIEFQAAAGDVIALVGASGSGKSTIAALVARLYDPSAGRVLLDGIDLRELDPEWLRRQIGSVAQEPVLFSSSIRDNIRYARPSATDQELEDAARAANAHDFIQGFPRGYETLVGERGAQLSGGQKQRIAIARALVKDPRVLILDEATSALDSESEYLIQEALGRLMRGRTTFVIAHRLSTVIDADRVLVIEGGTIVQSGSHAVLVEADGPYRRLVERQFCAA